MNPLCLYGIVRYELFLLGEFLLVGDVLLLYLSHLYSDVRKHEELRVADQGGDVLVTLVGQFDALVVLVDDEIQRIGDNMHFLVLVLHVEIVGRLKELFHSLLGKELDQRIVLRQSLVGSQKCHSAVFLVALGNEPLGFVEISCSLLFLKVVYLFNIRAVFLVLLVFSLRNRT